jgi:hypothetical protein
MLALEPQQRLAHRLAADRVTLGELLFPHFIAGRQTTGQNIRSQVFIDIIAQKHRNFLEYLISFAVVKYHVKSKRLEKAEF